MKHQFNTVALTERVIASFGRAHLVKHFNGRFELRGGNPADHQEAREWASMFLHEAICFQPQNR